MEKAMKQYSCWLAEKLPADLREELESIRDNKEEIYDRFCREITFGTSGLRGIMGAGTSRINSVVLKRATMGLCDDLFERYGAKYTESGVFPALALSYDTRVYSEGYGHDVAEILSARGVDTWIVESPQPVPFLSFAVRAMGLDGGIMITASHNPKQFNGYKVYDADGNQIDDEMARRIEGYIAGHGYFEQPETPVRTGVIRHIPKELIEAYRRNISDRAVWWQQDLSACREAMGQLSVVYTPLNGTGYSHVTEIFRRLGVGRVAVVESQTEGDGQFRTCPSPNPENRETFREAEALAYDIIEEGNPPPDLIIATDPDSDRMGVMVWQPALSGSGAAGGTGDYVQFHNRRCRPGAVAGNGKYPGEYILLSGNQAGELLFDYLCTSLAGEKGMGLKGKKAYKSLVSSPFVDVIARARGVEVENTLTGFKNIAQRIGQLCREGREADFLFGFEESLGYLYGTYTRDKDGVMASQLIALAAARWKAAGMTLLDRIGALHEQYGYMESRAWSLYFEKERDRQRMEEIMADLFEGRLEEVLGLSVTQDRTYEKERVFQGSITGSATHRFIIRPSGTELKLKAYVFAGGSRAGEAAALADAIMGELKGWLSDKKEEKRIE